MALEVKRMLVDRPDEKPDPVARAVARGATGLIEEAANAPRSQSALDIYRNGSIAECVIKMSNGTLLRVVAPELKEVSGGSMFMLTVKFEDVFVAKKGKKR